jgi:hypothetical protein
LDEVWELIDDDDAGGVLRNNLCQEAERGVPPVQGDLFDQ